MGYGDITSANDLERSAAIVGMIIGATVFGYIIGNVAVIMENFDIEDAIETAKMNQIKDWLYDRKVKNSALTIRRWRNTARPARFSDPEDGIARKPWRVDHPDGFVQNAENSTKVA